MNSKIQNIGKKIEALNNILSGEYSKLANEYGFSVNKKKIVFIKKNREKNRLLRIPTWQYAVPRNIRHFLSMPFIYMMIVPTVVMDIFITIYQWTAFSLCRIPKVKRNIYIVYDRRFLDYLNIIQKVNCLYCSYVNGFFAYALEIAARTERYWCPIKAANKPKFRHNWYGDFADYGNPEEWETKFNDSKAFRK